MNKLQQHFEPSGPPLDRPNLLHALFSWVWALNLLLYYVRFPVAHPFYLILLVPIAWVLVNPFSVWALLSFATAHLAVFVYESPLDSNYLTVTASLNLGILLCALSTRLPRTRQVLTFDVILPRLRPLIILIISATYLFSVFQKLNHSFLDPQTSHAVSILASMRQDDFPAYLAWLPSLIPQGAVGDQLAIWGTLFLEALIPVLFLVPRWRFAGIALDFIFHIVMGYRVYPPSTNFPCLLSSCMMLLFADSASTFLRSHFSWAGRLRAVAWVRRHRLAAFMGLLLFLIPFVFRLPFLPEGFHSVREFCRGNFWNLYVLTYAITLILYVRWARREGMPLAEGASALALTPRVLWLLPAAFTLQCLSPHLGLKTRASGEVYSGLLTFEGRSNHLIIPPSWQIFPYTKDTVTIVGPSNSPYIASLGKERAVMPYLHFIRLAQRNRRKSAEFLHRGELHRVERLGDIPDVAHPPFSFFELRFLPMHHVPEAEMERLRRNEPVAR